MQQRIVIFPLPRTLSESAAPKKDEESIVSTWKLDDTLRLPVFGLCTPTGFTNLLWKVDFVPHSGCGHVLRDEQAETMMTESFCESVLEEPAHLFLGTTGDGYRLTWIQEDGYDMDCSRYRRLLHDFPYGSINSRVAGGWFRPKDCKIVLAMPQWQDEWENRNTEQLSGTLICASGQASRMQNPKALKIAFTAFLSVAVLLQDILSRRPTLSADFHPSDPLSLPRYEYEVISVHAGGRLLEVLVVFAAGVGKGSLGVFLSVDILRQQYAELSWTRCSHDTPDPGMLALERRAENLRSVPDSNLRVESHPRDSAVGTEDFQVSRREADRMAALAAFTFPNCQVISNMAVLMQQPVTSIKARCAPVELFYG
jgi:hypothetical protein